MFALRMHFIGGGFGISVLFDTEADAIAQAHYSLVKYPEFYCAAEITHNKE